jgi:hypothetical protein
LRLKELENQEVLRQNEVLIDKLKELSSEDALKRQKSAVSDSYE